MNLTLTMKLINTLFLFFAVGFNLSAQCNNPDLEGLSWSPLIAGTTDEVTIVVAKEYESGCSGLEAKGDIVVDHDAQTIIIYFDQFCNDTMMCTQDVHCDSVNYNLTGLNRGFYDIFVLDTNSTNHICASSSHIDTLETGTINIHDVIITSDTVIGKPGTQQCIPFVFDGFQNVNTFQASISWDTLVLKYDTVRNLEPLSYFSPASIALNFTDDLRVIWFDFDVDGESIADGTTLFEVCFTLIGNDGDTSDVYFNKSLLNPEIENIDGDTLPIVFKQGQIIISEDRYAQCEIDTAEFLCEEWVMDSVMSSIANFCQNDSGYFRLEIIDWRGWEIVKMSRGYNSMAQGQIGQELFFACDGEFLGFCSIGGFAGGFCSDAGLSEDTTFVRHVWECTERLPGCYTTSNHDLSTQTKILRHTLGTDILGIKNEFVGTKYQILNIHGQPIQTGTLNTQLNIHELSSGVYWIKSGQSVESFVKSN